MDRGDETVQRTRASLLLRVRDKQDPGSWEEFVSLYGPLINRHLARLGVPHTDALDLNQDILRIVMIQITTGRFTYDPGRSFRAWLKRITRNTAYRHFRDRGRRAAVQGGTENLRQVGELAYAPAESDDPFEKEWRARRLQIAGRRVRERVASKTWEAFRRVVEGETPEQVARQLGMTVGAVFTYRSRVTAMLRKAVEEIDE